MIAIACQTEEVACAAAAETCELAVISDCHLGTRRCDGSALLRYLRSIQPQRLIINGDLCDLGSYLTAHWPAEHLAVLRRIVGLANTGCEVVLVIGNHDAALAHSPLVPAGIRLLRQHGLHYGGRSLRIIHGDIYDHASCSSPVLRWLGSHGYEMLQRIEGLAGYAARLLRVTPPSLVGPIKRRVPGARGAMNRFRAAALADARRQADEGILTGHIHAPRLELDGPDQILYANSGDWVEHRTALEGHDGALRLVQVPRGGGPRMVLAELPAAHVLASLRAEAISA